MGISFAMSALTLLAGGALLSAPADDFEWRGRLAAGKTIELVGVNGTIDASGTTGDQVEVTAVKSARRSDPDEVEIRVVEHEDGVTICAVYPAPRRREANECLPYGEGRNNVNNNDVKVEWTVKVPKGVRFSGRTVNGDVVARRLEAPVSAHTVNGDIAIQTSSWASAGTVNGWIDARLGDAAWQGDAEFDTVNGRITIDLPANASVEVHATTVNGSMSTDFPLTLRGKWGPRQMSGTIGEGGRRLNLNTVNGDMELRKGR